VGATGLFQVMPFHFQQDEDMYDPEANARRGLNFFARLLKVTDGDMGRTLAAYNGGLGGTNGPMATWPAETRAYYRWGKGIYEEATAGLAESATLQAWLRSGGASLCAGRVGR
jgi:soluble lytic murein transglycosylase-like protein